MFLLVLFYVEHKRRQLKKSIADSSEGNSSSILAKSMADILESLKNKQNWESTSKNYFSIWRQFNKFVIKLDIKPMSWEDRMSLFVVYLIEHRGMQSSTIHSYVSAIKSTLINDGYDWQDQKILLTSLTKACRLVNNRVITRMPIQCGLLEVLLFELERIYANQPYLEIMYKSLLALGFYGLMRIGKLTKSEHSLKARDVHLALNKEKLVLVLYTSKTHNVNSLPQKIKITSNRSERSGRYAHRNFCPFKLVGAFIQARGAYENEWEEFFVFPDGSPVLASHVRLLIKMAISSVGLNADGYNCHSLRIGRTTDLIKYGYTLDKVKMMGHWRSSCVYKYIR